MVKVVVIKFVSGDLVVATDHGEGKYSNVLKLNEVYRQTGTQVMFVSKFMPIKSSAIIEIDSSVILCKFDATEDKDITIYYTKCTESYARDKEADFSSYADEDEGDEPSLDVEDLHEKFLKNMEIDPKRKLN